MSPVPEPESTAVREKCQQVRVGGNTQSEEMHQELEIDFPSESSPHQLSPHHTGWDITVVTWEHIKHLITDPFYSASDGSREGFKLGT